MFPFDDVTMGLNKIVLRYFTIKIHAKQLLCHKELIEYVPQVTWHPAPSTVRPIVYAIPIDTSITGHGAKHGKTRKKTSYYLKVYYCVRVMGNDVASLHWRHNRHDGVSNHQPHDCLLNHLFRRRSKKTSKLRVTGLCVGNLPGPVNSPHKGPVTRKMFPFDDVIMMSPIIFFFWTLCLLLLQDKT